jgi:hypothetical protein
MATETEPTGAKSENPEKKQDGGKGIMIAAVPAFIAALASITGVVINQINQTRMADQTNTINQAIAHQTNEINKNIATSTTNANMLDQIIIQQILPYRERLQELLSAINVEFILICKLSEAETNDKLAQALEQLNILLDRPPYRWDKTVLQQMKDYNFYVANAYGEISTGHATEEKKQEYNQEAGNLRKKLLEAIDDSIPKLGE